MRPFWRRFYIATETIAALCSDLILSQNREDIETAVRQRICRREKLKYLGNGFDVQAFDQAPLTADVLSQLRAELGFPAGAPVVGFVGRLVAEKGVVELLQAFQAVISQVPAARLLIVGPADLDKPDALTPAVARDFGLEAACVFTGRRADMPQLYALMDVLVLPSHREGFPRTPMEASLMGVPSVVTDVRGCREAVEHGQNGLIVPLGDIPALSQAIVTLLTDRPLARRLGETGRRMARARFDERQVFHTVKKEYARLLRQKGLPAPQPSFEAVMPSGPGDSVGV
jgi:glycosyltransferase involved in cell wall biosynthesis